MDCCRQLSDYVSRKAKSYSTQQWIIVFVFCLSYLFAASVSSLQAPFYPSLAESKGVSATQCGLVFGVFQIFVFISSPIFGKYMNYLGAKYVFHIGLLTIGVSCFIFGFLDKVNDHTSFITLSFAIRIIEAIGSSALCTAAFTIIAGEFPDSISTTFASLETFYGLGLIVGPSLGGLLYEIGGFVLPFTVIGACLVLTAFITPFLMPNGKSMHGGDCKDDEGFSLFTLLKIPAATISAIIIWTSSNNIGFLNATLEPHLRQFALSELYVGLVFMSAGISYAISAPLFGKLMDNKVHPKWVALCGCILLILAHLIIGPAIFIPVSTELSTTCIGLVIHGVGVGAIQVAGFILALRESIANGFPDNLSTYSVVSGLWASALSLGLFVGPSLGGMLLDYSNFRIGSLYPLVCSFTALILVIVFIIQHDRNGKNEYYKNGADSSESTKLLINSYAGSMSISRHKEIHGISEPVQKYGN